MIDDNGYRLNVGIVLCNTYGQVLWAKRYKQCSWQFPQGGINIGETPEQAMYRELFEEIGLNYCDVRILSITRCWFCYKLPTQLVRWRIKPLCLGQKQKWFLLKLLSKDTKINMKTSKVCTFDTWQWVSLWYPIRQVVFFKRHVYRKVMKEFVKLIISR
ncbi:NTP pyrophospohydrolase [Candidatus Blochmanniella floridana]|uniref:RNA pyrophosphohydrolase n=1 Tax=Blochmanniella floridana TaxID=203907 RepID=RPPH_BLOFL|nr:RecName: Full=RNA pyrophosphohydrolase; AltName: Full=(Di)nucleoside polyphosphate hydrolase [Candidatus Blochmannia floridanus]CAD83335.1 NTP pyrophospohydrolase [Candidatus Blochmannia floridanus]